MEGGHTLLALRQQRTASEMSCLLPGVPVGLDPMEHRPTAQGLTPALHTPAVSTETSLNENQPRKARKPVLRTSKPQQPLQPLEHSAEKSPVPLGRKVLKSPSSLGERSGRAQQSLEAPQPFPLL